MSHTPGPWEVEERWHDTAIKARGGTETVARVSPRYKDRANEVANARLIAAAPDLLEAAANMRAVLNRALDAYVEDDDTLPVAVLERAMEEIARAQDKVEGSS